MAGTRKHKPATEELTSDQVAILQAAHDELQEWCRAHQGAISLVDAGAADSLCEMATDWLITLVDPEHVAWQREYEREREEERREERRTRRERREQAKQESQQRPPRPPMPQSSAPWDVLHVASNAPLAVARAAFRALSKSAHPDVGGSHDEMKRLTAAIEAFEQHAKTRGR